MNSELEHRIIQYLTNSMSSVERADFEQDLDSDGQLMNEFIAFKSVWDLTESLSYESSDSDMYWSNFESSIMDEPNTSSSKLTVVKIAASILIIAVSSILIWKPCDRLNAEQIMNNDFFEYQETQNKL